MYDVIWNPGTVKKAKTEVLFRSGMIELAFAYVLEKHKHTLNMRWSIPKMKYKGDTVQFQRIRAKKAPKIEEVDSTNFTEEEKRQMEQKGLEQNMRDT